MASGRPRRHVPDVGGGEGGGGGGGESVDTSKRHNQWPQSLQSGPAPTLLLPPPPLHQAPGGRLPTGASSRQVGGASDLGDPRGPNVRPAHRPCATGLLLHLLHLPFHFTPSLTPSLTPPPHPGCPESAHRAAGVWLLPPGGREKVKERPSGTGNRRKGSRT